MNNKPLHIPPTKKLKGLKVFCYECGTTVDAVCKKTGSNIAQCKYGHEHVFKAIAHVPGTANARKTKTLTTRTLDEARRLTLEFQQEIKEKNTAPLPAIIAVPAAPSDIHHIDAAYTQPNTPPSQTYNLLALLSQYVDYQHNENIPEFKHRQRSKKHVEDVERTIKYFVVSLSTAGYAVEHLRIDSIDDTMLGTFHTYLLRELAVSNSSYNRALSVLSGVYNYLNRSGYLLRNPFALIPRRPTEGNKETITKNEYDRLLTIVEKPELGIQILKSKQRKNVYKPFLRFGIELGALTGRRNEEIVHMTWSEVYTDEQGNLSYIRVPDFKASRRRGNHTTENLKHIYVPITEELLDLLNRMGYERYRGTSKYILAPEAAMHRSTINLALTTGFKHYYDQLGTGRHLSYKCLRKTYISQLSRFMGIENARHITKHSDIEIMQNHYVDERSVIKSAHGFSVFDTEPKSVPIHEQKKEKDNHQIER